MNCYDERYKDKSNEQLWEEYAATKSLDVKQELAMRYLYIVKTVILRMSAIYSNFSETDDMIQEGVVILMNLIDRYEISRSVKFETYLSIRVKGMVYDLARKSDWNTRDMRKNIKQVEKAVAELTMKNGRTPGHREVCEYLDIPYEKYENILSHMEQSQAASLEAMTENMDTGGPAIMTGRASEQPELNILHQDEIRILEDGIRQLREKEKIVISLYYVEGLKMREIAPIMDVTETRVSQIHSNALKKLKNYVAHEYAEA